MRRLSAKQSLLIVIVLLALAMSIFLRSQGVPFVYAYLTGVSVIALLLYGYAKFQSKRGGFRIPELILHAVALAGGTPGALLGQQVFRHKTTKRSFRVWFSLIALLQLLGIGLYLLYTHR